MSGNRLFHIPNLLTSFEFLEELYLANNDLTKLPNWIGSLSKLRIIDGTNNGIRYIPESVAQLNDLQTLNLSNNTITKLPLFLASLPVILHCISFGFNFLWAIHFKTIQLFYFFFEPTSNLTS